MASAQERNQRGTRQAMQKASALQRRGTRASHSSSGRPSKRAIRNREWDQNADRQRAEFKERGYGGMGYGPTAPDSAMKKANARANPNQMVRDVIGKMTEPTVVRAEGSIWDDPKYAGLANEHGGEYAMKARNLDRQLNMARQTQAVMNESMADQFGREQMKRDNMRDQMAFQQEAAAYGTPAQVSEAFQGAQRAPDGSIVRPGGQSVVPGSPSATSPTSNVQPGQPTYTGQPGGPDQTVAPPPIQPAEEGMTPQDQVKLLESYSKMLTDVETPEETKRLIRQALPQLLPQPQGGGGNQSPYPDYPDAFQEGDNWFVERDGKRYRLEE